jgi:nucleoside-diphosphate-sugar epimerase
MTRLLITGASGFIGAHCLHLIEQGGGYDEIHAVTRRREGPDTGRVIRHTADLRSAVDAVRVIDAVRPTHLFHGAWMATPGVYLSSPENLDWMQAGIALVRAFAEQGGQRFVGIGSSAEYAASATPCEEDGTPLRPGSVYGECKVALWFAVQALARHHKMQAAWGRLFLPYGPGDPPPRLIPTVLSHLRAGKPLSLSHGEQKRDFIYVPDAARMFVRLLKSEATGAFNIGTGESRSVRSVIEAIADRLSARDCLRFGEIPLREGEPPVLVASMKKFDKLLGTEAVTPFSKILDALIAVQSKSAH